MRKLTISSVSVAAISLGAIVTSATAHAADQSSDYAPDWTGAYMGVNAGIAGFGSKAIDNDGDMFDGEGSELYVFGNGGVFGGQIGYNLSHDTFVYGLEADIQGTTLDEKTSTDGDDHRAEGGWDWFATVRGRLGLTYGNALLYATGGLAIVNARYCGADGECVTDGDEDLSFDATQVGYTVGGGAEILLSDHVSVKGEYLFVDTGNLTKTYDAGSDETATFSSQAHIFRVGANYNFNAFASEVPGLSSYGEKTYTPFGGFYAGVNAGIAGFGSKAIDNDSDMFDGEGSELNVFGNGGVFGGQIGYNLSHDTFVYGLEADIQGTTLDEKTSTDGDDHRAEGGWDWFATVRGRIGITHGNALLYATGGLAIVNARYCGADRECVTDGDEDLSFDATQVGYTVGGGAEILVSDHVSVKGEYLFVDTGNLTKTYDAGSDETATFSSQAHIFRVGANYNFR